MDETAADKSADSSGVRDLGGGDQVQSGSAAIKTGEKATHAEESSKVPQAVDHPSAVQKADIDDYDDDDDDDLEESDEYSESGEESDIEDNDEVIDRLSQRIARIKELKPDLPNTVTVLNTEWGSKVYLVGTAHFSHESQQDVAKTIRATQPDVVMVELCQSRMHILHLDEATLLEEAKNINMEKIRHTIKESGFVQGITYLLLLNMSAHVTKELGMAPGGEFRQAFKEAQLVPNCRLQLGDRPIQITVKRVLASLSYWQTLRLTWHLLCSKEPINKEDVEKCKDKDLLEQMLKELAGEFPALTEVVVKERDLFLTNSLKLASGIRCPVTSQCPNGLAPSVVVGVVGMGHVPGIVANWNKETIDISEVMKIPPATLFGKILRWGVRVSLVGAVGLGCYRLYTWTAALLF